MRLYHTGNTEIREPDISHGRKNADFGPGFYLTPDLEFARRWAGAEAVLNEYEFDETGLWVHRFSRDEDWFRYIFQNRRGRDSLEADAVSGPVANDTIFDTLGIISSGFLKPEDAMRLLMIGPEYSQVAVKTGKAAARLRWIRSERIAGMDGELRRPEREEYEAAFAQVLQEIIGKE